MAAHIREKRVWRCRVSRMSRPEEERKSRKRRDLSVHTANGHLQGAGICNAMNDLVCPLFPQNYPVANVPMVFIAWTASLISVSRLVLRLDTNERPFQCPQCSSTFGRLDTLLRHERTLHGSSTSAASNNTTHQRTGSTNLGAKPALGRSNSTTGQHMHQHQHQPLDPPLSRVRESPTMSHHNVNPSPII